MHLTPDEEIERLKADYDKEFAHVEHLRQLLEKSLSETIALRQENERLKGDIDSADCAHADEIAAHQETLILWEKCKSDNAALRQQVAELELRLEST